MQQNTNGSAANFAADPFLGSKLEIPFGKLKLNLSFPGED